MTEKFTREDLKSGYVVKLRDGTLRMVARAGNFTKILVAESGEWSYLNSGWGNDLKAQCLYPTSHCENGHSQGKSDIVEVYGLIGGTANYGLCRNISTECRSLLWQRKEAVKMTIEEISKKLGFDVEIVAGHYK